MKFITPVLFVLVIVFGCALPNHETPPEPTAETNVSLVAQVITAKAGSVESADGTRIGFSTYGSGPAIIVCHGTHTVAQDWAAFGQELGRRYTVYVYDRRGRGNSDDTGKPYTNESEIDDLAAMVKLARPDAAILGHSFGGGVALAYALRAGFKGRLVLVRARALSIAGGGPRPPARAKSSHRTQRVRQRFRVLP